MNSQQKFENLVQKYDDFGIEKYEEQGCFHPIS